MNIYTIAQVLSEVKEKLSVRLNLAEQKTPSQQNPNKLAGAKKRLANLYGKLTKGRDDSNKVKATGAKR